MLIAFSGVAQSGKSTAANYLVEKYGFKKHGFATAVKEAVEALDPVVEYFDKHTGYHDAPLSEMLRVMGWDKAKQEPNIRRLLQRMGTEVGRGIFGEDFWVDRLFADLEKKYGTYTKDSNSKAIKLNVVIDDTRFANEALAVKAHAGLVVEINRGTEPFNEHASEIPLPPNLIDGTINNLGSLDELHHGIEDMLDFINF